MKMSTMVSKREKQSPQGIVAKSHELLLRAGFIKQVSNGVYSMFTPGLKVQKKIESIVRKHMDNVGGQEVLFPVLMPKELWEESGRYSTIGNEMFRFKDRFGHDMVLGMTHEEAAVHMAKNTINSYEQMPCMIYQIQSKFRDEQRPRAGLLRVKEFIMKDAYSFHETESDLNDFYQKMHTAYTNIFKEIGIKDFLAVESDSGMMGGNKTHEFMFLSHIGEDTLAVCNNCDYTANVEVAKSILNQSSAVKQSQELVHTPNKKTIAELEEFFNLNAANFAKAVVYWATNTKKYYVVFIRADLDISKTKLENLVGDELVLTDDFANEILIKGFIGPNFKAAPDSEVVYDISLKNQINLIVGANKHDYHIKGFSFKHDVKDIKFNEVYEVAQGHTCAQCKTGKLSIKNGIEIGHIFALGTKYTQSMNMTVHNKQGQLFHPTMGCYGIGIGRAISSIVEQNHDDKGIIWPVNLAPWQIYLAPIKSDLSQVKEASQQLYETLQSKGYEVLFDDRQTSPGVKFAESELMGIPLRIVVSPRTLQNNVYEISVRSTGEKLNVKQD